jgi:hypothetical protein
MPIDGDLVRKPRVPTGRAESLPGIRQRVGTGGGVGGVCVCLSICMCLSLVDWAFSAPRRGGDVLQGVEAVEGPVVMERQELILQDPEQLPALPDHGDRLGACLLIGSLGLRLRCLPLLAPLWSPWGV